MSDLISRQTATDAMRELPYGYRGIVWDILNSLPSVQPEQKTGRWKKRYISDYRFQFCCSECGMIQVYGEPNYCPNCGAKMDMERE